MGHSNFPPWKRSITNTTTTRQWRLLDLVSLSFFSLVILFFVLLFTTLGDSLTASGRRTLVLSATDQRQRNRILLQGGVPVPVRWLESLHKIWHDNMPHNKIADRKGHQGWPKLDGQYFIFPGGDAMFPDGAEQYVEKLGQYISYKWRCSEDCSWNGVWGC